MTPFLRPFYICFCAFHMGTNSQCFLLISQQLFFFLKSGREPEISILYSGTRLGSKLLAFFGFSVCSHVYLLNYRSETGSNLETRYRYHPRSQSYQKKFFNASAARNNGP